METSFKTLTIVNYQRIGKINMFGQIGRSRRSYGFTIVELLVVIVIIGILAAITIISYTGVSNKANQATLQSDLANNAKKLSMYYTQYGEYPHINPTSGCPEAPSSVDNNYCLKFSKGSTFSHVYKTPTTYSLTATLGDLTYAVTESSSPKVSSAVTCPTGFIVVPGSAIYGTSDFCVMKYEAKNAGGNVPVSTATGSPWVNISQTDAVTYSANVAGCTGCHLITEAEWMTLAKDVLSVASNWSGGSVGSGYIYSGHNDSAPNNALDADSNDTNGYAGETNTGGNQKRTLTLTNGEVIWDIAGNVWEWTSGQTANGSVSQPGINGGGYIWREYTSITNNGSLAVNVFPGGTGLTGASSWNSGTNGIGRIYSNADDTVQHGAVRGGHWYHGATSGVLALYLIFSPSVTAPYLGFRVSK